MPKIMGGLVAILVGVSLLPEVTKQMSKGYSFTPKENITHDNHRQTYLEYVKERLEFERLMK